MDQANLRPYRGSDKAALIHLWIQTLTLHPLDKPAFRPRVLLDASDVWAAWEDIQRLLA